MRSSVFHLEPNGRLANQMIQYLVALKFVDLVGGDCRISGVNLPGWGIECPPIAASGPTISHVSEQHVDLAALAEQVRSGRAERVEWHGFGQRMENLLPRERYRNVFPCPFGRAVGFGSEYLVCPVRAEEIANGEVSDYVLTPVEFYRDVVALTGLKPVFIGQTGSNAYMDRIRAAFPSAIIREPQQDNRVDFETIRYSRHVAVGVSTYSWLAAWLSETVETIHMTVSGLFHPRQRSNVDLLPFGDERYRFFLFPINYAVPLDRHAEAHRRIAPFWHLQPQQLLRRQFAEAPRFEWTLDAALEFFDEDFYLNAHADVAKIAATSGRAFGRGHFQHFGFREGRHGTRLDKRWYALRYPLAAFEVGRGDFADFYHHYIAVGRARGYLPFPQNDEW